MSTINDIGLPGIGTGILHPKHKNRWRVTFAGMGGGFDSQPVSMQSIKVDRPKLKFEKVTLHRYNSIAYIAAKHSWETMALTVQDDVLGTASRVIQAQLQKQQWLIGAEGQWMAAAGEGSLYKFSSDISMLDGNDQVIERWIVEGCWLENVEWGELVYESGDPVEIALTVSYDHARQILGGYSQGPGSALGGPGRI
jgi:hypothetical protein